MRPAFLAMVAAAFWCSAQADVVACPQRPANIQVAPLLESVVESFFGMSPTLSKQCDRIAAAPLVRVMVGVLPKKEESCCRARTVIRRYPSGVILAYVEIPSPRRRDEYAELLGHEFEHIVEHLDDVELEPGAHASEGSADGRPDRQETRAQEAGRAVAAEVERNRAGEL